MESGDLFDRIRPREGWLTFLLPLAMLLISAGIVAEADLAREYQMTFLLLSVSGISAVLGLALARSRFPAITAHIYSLIYGLFFVTYFIGRTMPAEMLWRERVAELVFILSTWVQQVFNGGTNREILVWVTYTTAIYWLLGYVMMWYTFRRRRVWPVVLPAGLVAFSVVYYYFGPRPLDLALGVYCLLALLYIAQIYLLNNQAVWAAQRVQFDAAIGGNFVRSTLLVAVLALLLAWQLPALTASAAVMDTVSDVNQPWREFRDSWQRLFAALDSSYSQGVRDAYTTSMDLGGPRNPGETPVMDVWVDEPLPYAYWRAQVLHRYDGQWHELDGDTEEWFPDDQPLSIPVAQDKVEVRQRFINYVPDAGTIYGAPDIVASSRQMLVRGTTNPAGTREVSNTRARFVLQQGDQYEVISRLSTADQWSLREASTNYPNYIRDTYLQVPPSVTPETLALAEEIMAQYNNPFDKAIAVRDWLRANIRYNDQVDFPPPNVDPVHYMLFESQEGFCNYYASAMALMLRSQGVPTRVARGFAAGEFIEDTNTYRVRAYDAHTWPEVYFPGYGWIQFEPTASIPTVDRAEGQATGGGDNFNNAEAQENAAPEDPIEDVPLQDELTPEEALDIVGDQDEQVAGGLSGLAQRVSPWQVIVGMVIIGGAFVAVTVADRWNRGIESDVMRSYSRLAWWGRRLGVPMTPTQTPYERERLLAQAVPDGAPSIQRLIQAYVERTFSPVKQSTWFNALGEWRTLRPLLVRRAVRRKGKR